jgi:ribosomal protein S13
MFLVAPTLWLLTLSAPAVAAPENAPPPAAAPTATKIKPAEPAAAAITGARIQEVAKATGLTSEVVRTSLEYMARFKPRLAHDLENMAKMDPRQIKSNVNSCVALARDLEQLKKSDPVRGVRREQTLELEGQSERLTDRYKEVGETERVQVEVELTNVLAKLFDLRLEEDRYQMDQAKKQLDQMESRVRERLRNKDRIVDRQMTTLLGLNAFLAW